MQMVFVNYGVSFLYHLGAIEAQSKKGRQLMNTHFLYHLGAIEAQNEPEGYLL